MDNPRKSDTPTESYEEIQIGKTRYCVTSIFTGEQDLEQLLEQLVLRRLEAEIDLSDEPSRDGEGG